jgi:hypothetical protein
MDPGFNDDEVGTEDALVAALLEIHRGQQRRAPGGASESAYARVLSHFEKRGRRLRGERLVTDELLDRLFSSAKAIEPALPQQEVAIAGPIGAVAAGRFVLRNPSPVPQQVGFAVGAGLDGGWQPALRFSPERPALAANGACVVRVEADLGQASSPVSVTIPVECRTGGRRARLWLVVEAFDARGGAR